MQEISLSRKSFEKFSDFLVAFAPRFAAHLDPVHRPSFNYGFGVKNVHFRASFSRYETGAGYTLSFNESSMNPNSVCLSCSISETGELLKVVGSNVTAEQTELIFSTFRQIVLKHRFLL